MLSDKERWIKLFNDFDLVNTPTENFTEHLIDYIISNGAILPPCKVGDKYYRIEKFCTEGGYHNEPKQASYSDCEYCCSECDKELRIVEYQFNSVIQILEKQEYIDKYIFLTPEAAKEALNKRLNNT